jgi:N-acetylmuramoyl-L-alanine amidase
VRVWLTLALAAVCFWAFPAQAKVSHGKLKPEPAKAVTLMDLQQYPDKDRYRLVAVLSGPATRRWKLLPPGKSGKKVRLLYLDLDNTRPGPSLPDSLATDDPRVGSVKISPYKPGVTRLVLTVTGTDDCRVSFLDNPFRVVLDVVGQAKVEAKAEAPAKAKSPAPVQAAYAPPAGGRKMARQLVEQLGLTVRTVMIDPGHGGKDPGATGVGGLREKDVTLRLAKMLGPRLEEMGFTVLYTREKDVTVPLKSRPLIANAKKADLFISIHCNASSDHAASGLEVYSLNLASTPEEARVAARENAGELGRISEMQKILDDLMHSSKMCESKDFAQQCREFTLKRARQGQYPRDRGLHEAPLFVLLGTKMPAILVEVGYITNPGEAAKLRDPDYLERVAHGLADGILAYRHRVERYAAKQ